MKHLIKSKHPKPHLSMPRLLGLVFGALIFSNIIYADSASALTLGVKNENPQFFTPLKKNDEKMKELDKVFEAKIKTVNEQEKIVEQVEEEAQKVVETKQTFEQKIEQAKDEVEELKAQVAEKKRLEALRIVEIKGYASDASGNAYAAGNCTWYVKSKRPDIGNYWGNANMWLTNAQAAGFKTGAIAKKGAIGVTQEGWAGHVVYVESWNDDETVTISEMNAGGLYVTGSRTVPESSFMYIYEKG